MPTTENSILDKPRYSAQEQLDVANRVLRDFSRVQLVYPKDKSSLYLEWEDAGSKMMIKASARSLGSLYLRSHGFPGGGTAENATMALVRWLRGLPTVPRSTWRYWQSDSVNLGVTEGSLQALFEAGYPEAVCCLCGRFLEGVDAWWYQDDVAGPCCTVYEGCKQNR